jgi:Folliculin-interacting protein N-terminus
MKGVSIESNIEESHSRALLWPGFLSSPPSTPIGSPTFRIGPFDDRGGLELNESKDVRIIIAQDAFGSMDRPTVLFDTQHQRGGPIAKAEQPIPWSSQQQRNRSTTISGPSAAWSRPNRDIENNDKVHRLLDCMFGVTSATKSESSTKMHVLSSGSEQPASPVLASASLHKDLQSRAPLHRSRTSYHVGTGQRPSDTPKDEKSSAEDVVLVTRMFTVTLPESKEQIPPRAEDSQAESPLEPSGQRSDSFGAGKKPKLIEKKIPMYAIGLLLTMPPEDLRPAVSRPPSRTSFTSSSFPNSFGSDLASSWTLLDSIPDSLGSSSHSQKRADRRIEFVTNIWDVILRSLTYLEHVARSEIRALLQQVNREIMASMVKTPKGPQEQRTNQRNIYIRNHLALAEVRALHKSCRQVLQRISSALRIPRVVTGTGFLDGHWLDEARYLVQVCGSKPQNFFLFNLLTAFLGNHTEWLEKLGALQSRSILQQQHRRSHQNGSLTSRTVIVAERRSIARRLIFLLASFLPTPSGVSALEKDLTLSKSPLPTPGLPSSSPLRHSFKAGEVAQERQRQFRGHHVSFGAADVGGLSTSASSNGSVDLSGSAMRPRPRLGRKDSDPASIRTASMFPISNSSLHLRKASAANSATTPQPTNPIAYFAAKGDSYFPEDVIADGSESVASADLARILRRDSSSFAMPSPKWPALLSGFWPKRPDTAGTSAGSQTPARTSSDLPRRGSLTSDSQPNQSGSKLDSMVSEANGVDVPQPRNGVARAIEARQAGADVEVESVARSVDPPRLRVDQDDGVIDVDVGIAGFMSWEGDNGPVSPPKDHQPSVSHQSLDGVASMRSSVSLANSQAAASSGDCLNVAGFLRKYHEDFVLQAVKPYEELQEDVKQSMLRESRCLEDADDMIQSADTSVESEWVDVCSTLIADLRKHSIEHIILRRKRPQRPTSSEEQSVAASTPSRETPDAEQHFLVEPVVSFDMTLTDAIESILDTANRYGTSVAGAKGSHKRTTSSSTAPSTSVSTPPSSLSTGSLGSRRPQHLRANCRQVMTDALEEVVKSVQDDLHLQEEGRVVESEGKPGKQDTSEENVLREGVRRWLLKEETRSVW